MESFRPQAPDALTTTTPSLQTASANSLKERLEHAKKECRHLKYFIPKDAQENLITIESITEDILAADPQIKETDASQHATDSHKYARQLYATLACVKKGADIGSLLGEGLTDKDLPFVRKVGEFTLLRGSGEPIKTCQKWKSKKVVKFDHTQWSMTAPVFESQEHYELHENTVLPFFSFDLPEIMKTPKQGGYSEVYPVRIHPAHHEFWGNYGTERAEPLVALKVLFSSDEQEYLKEATILRALGSKNQKHPHLIKLLATYKHERKYHLMFPYADANLRDYWETKPNPAFDEGTVLWSLRQISGIANALLLIHNFRVTIPLSVPGPGQIRVQTNAELSVHKGEEKFGRHGDIKPENILWFEKSPDTDDERGILQIADFGLGRFHGRDSRSNIPPESVQSSPTYEPPECKLRRPVSRAYDLWSLGCLYLEFITWLLKGSAEIVDFSNFRGRTGSLGINEDNFFTIINDDAEGQKAVVRDAVLDWVQQLHEHPRCSALIHDLLKLTIEELLVINSSERSKTTELSLQLKAYLETASENKEYMLKPVPWEKKDKDDERPKLLNSPKAKGRKVSFDARISEYENPPGFSKSQSSIPKDLLLRTAGTPGLIMDRKVKSAATWPLFRPLQG